MRVLICGSRTLQEDDLLDVVIYGLADVFGESNVIIINGAAEGADSQAQLTAEARQLATETYPADWATHDKAAGPIRNQQMLDEGRPEAVLAFVDKPLAESKGTADMVNRAKRAGIPTYVIEKVS